MLKLSIIALVLAVNCILIEAAAVDNNHKVEYFSDRLKNIIKRKCMANAGETEYNEALAALDTFRNKWEITIPKERPVGVAFFNHCMNEAQNFSSYLVKLIDNLLPCLKSEEDFLKPFIINSYGDYNQHLCKFMELLSVSAAKQSYNKKCNELLENHEIDPYYACYKDSKIFGDNATVSAITKHEICEDILDIRCCYDKIFEEHCLEIPEFSELQRVLLTQSLTQCVDELESSEENSSEKVKGTT